MSGLTNISVKVALKRVEQLTGENMNLHLTTVAQAQYIEELEKELADLKAKEVTK